MFASVSLAEHNSDSSNTQSDWKWEKIYNSVVLISSEKSPESCKYYHNPNIKWLYCIPKYPCSLSEINFQKISKFHGFSNHCPEITAPLTAINSGIDIIEVHVTEDKTKEYFDNNVSFDFSELKILITEIRKINKNN